MLLSFLNPAKVSAEPPPPVKEPVPAPVEPPEPAETPLVDAVPLPVPNATTDAQAGDGIAPFLEAVEAEVAAIEATFLPAASPAEPAAPEFGDLAPAAEPGENTTAHILAQHKLWLASGGQGGSRADFSGASLHAADFHAADLREAIFRKADLTGADFSFADLRGAWLAHANLRKANLLGAQLREAGLQGASVEGAFGLLAGQLACTNLFSATMERQIPAAQYEVMKLAERYSRVARALCVALLASCALSVLLVAGTTDVQLISKADLIPLPLAARLLPADVFLLIGPLALLAVYISFHVFLLRAWEQLAQLPHVFPDGFAVDKKGTWLLMSLIRPHCRWLAQDGPVESPLNRAVLILSVYWTVPAVLLFFWARYLTRLHIHATIYHVGLIVAASLLAIALPTFAKRLFQVETLRQAASPMKHGLRELLNRSAAPLILGAVLALLSIGTVYGVPRNCDLSVAAWHDVRRWAPRALWLVGYDPFPDIAEAAISTRPANWNGENISLVRGARLDGFSLRHAQAYRAFFVNAGLRDAELDHAELSESDFRGANLRHASLQFADLSGARLNGASMEGAQLHNARLVRADLREANLSFSFLPNAVLIDASLVEANLFGADLRGASLLSARMEKADLRDSNLERARLDQAILRGAYLWSAKLAGAQLHDAQLQSAILIDADLRNAILRGANLEGAVLRGANLEGTDFRGALGLTTAQLCPALGWHKAYLDEPLRQSAEQTCSPLPRPLP